MADSSLRSRTLRLAAEAPELRPVLVRVLEAAGGMTDEERVLLALADDRDLYRKVEATFRNADQPPVYQQSPVVIQQPPIIIQQGVPGGVVMDNGAPTSPPAAPVAPAAPTPPTETGPPPVAALFVTERTQQGFMADLLPEMERLLATGLSKDQVAQRISALVNEAFQVKNHLYNILIRHQSMFEGDAEYKESLDRLIQAWMADTTDFGG